MSKKKQPPYPGDKKKKPAKKKQPPPDDDEGTQDLPDGPSEQAMRDAAVEAGEKTEDEE